MQTLFRRAYQKICHREGYYDELGRWQQGEAEASLFFATIRPLAMDKLSPQLQGQHISSAIVIYCDEPLNVAGEDLQGGDLVVFDEQQYRVVSRAHFPTTSLRHYRYHAVRVNNGS